MKRTVSFALAGVLLAGTAVATAQAAEVTAERLLNAAGEPNNWLMIHRTYDSHRYSPLDVINRDNVKNLHPVFNVAIGGMSAGGNYTSAGNQATPLAEDGVIYTNDGWGTVYRIDATSGKSGRIEWIMDPGVDRANVWIPSNRGLTMYKNYIVSVTGEGSVHWTNKDTGELVNSVQVADPVATGYSLTTPPLAIGDKLIVGGTGGDRGARAHIDAINADTGEQIWRFYTVPAPGEPGSETWKDNNNAWEHGGGSYWMTGSYDPDTNLTIWGTGQPVPMFDPEYRPGDNLFTNSAVALDVGDGSLKWYFQYTPGDYLDYDEIGVHQLIDADVNGEPRKLVAHFGRNGFFYTLDRTNGQFVAAAQYVDQLNWTAGIDPKTGKPVEYDPAKDLQTYAIGSPEGRRAQGQLTGCPNIQGGVNYFPTAYNEDTKLSYGAGIEGCSTVAPDPDAIPAGNWLGGTYANTDRITGSISAMDPSTGQRVAQHLFPYAVYSGVATSAGGLVFTVTAEGTFYALDASTLEPLYSYNIGTTSGAAPMVYGVDGKQYVAILGGAGALAAGMLNKSPEMADIQNTSMLYVFGL